MPIRPLAPITVIFIGHAYHRRVEPVEINAGAWYLRAPRDDELIDDRPALASMGESDPGYIARCTAQWATDTGYTWAVCEPTTGEMLAEVTDRSARRHVDDQARDGHEDAAAVAEQSVRRFATAMLGLTTDPIAADREVDIAAGRQVGAVHLDDVARAERNARAPSSP